MAKTSRRNLLKAAAAGSVAGLGLAIKPGTAAPAVETRAAGAHMHRQISGPLANASVSFGQWPTPLDRFPNLGAPGIPNGHQLIPNEATIKEGGTVNFIIGGFHQVLVYDDGTQPGEINANLLEPTFPLLIDDPNKRIYRGLNPQLFPQDRVEVVHFSTRGTYLVICGFRPHFVDDRMFGFVRVLP